MPIQAYSLEMSLYNVQCSNITSMCLSYEEDYRWLY